MPPSIIAIIPAGGVGERAQHKVQGQSVPKQYRQIAHQSMLKHSVRALLADDRVSLVLIGVAPDDGWIEREDFSEFAGRVQVLRTGGATRADTVFNTLQACAAQGIAKGEEAWALVHDAARPGLPSDCLSDLISSCLTEQRGGLLALPVGDTVKRARVEPVASDSQVGEVSADVGSTEQRTGLGRSSITAVEETISREGLWLAQTPQMFPAASLAQALEVALEASLAQNFTITDEASAMEFIGEHPLLLKGHWRNLKVTWPSDFDLVEQFL